MAIDKYRPHRTAYRFKDSNPTAPQFGGASIVYEGGIGSAIDRVAVVRNKAGAVILEEKNDQNSDVFYSIVTAIPGKQNQQGTRIGSF